MTVAIAYNPQTGEVFEHFGHCPYFAVYQYGEYVEDCRKSLIDTSMLSGHQQMCDRMKELSADAVVAVNMGEAAQKALLECGILPVIGARGNADYISDLLVTGQLTEGGCSCGGSCGCGDSCSCGDSCVCGECG